MVITITTFRPLRSPIQPNSTAPMGRAIKPTDQVAKLESSAIAGVACGKKTSPKMMPAARP